MDFELKDLLDAIGPTASLIFAAWIFLSFLQARYSSAYDRYRGLIEKYRAGIDKTKERQSVLDQVILYRARVEQMRRATNIGVIAAIFLIATLVAAGLHVITGELPVFKYLSAACAFIGLILVAAAATYVLRENSSIREGMESEPSDVPDLDRRLHSQED